MPSLWITVTDHESGERHQHRAFTSPVRVGRDQSNDLVLTAAYVARWQAVLSFTEESLSVVLLGAANPLRHGAKPLSPGVQTELASTDALTLGSLELRLRLCPEESRSPQVTRAGPPSPDEGAALQGSIDPAPGELGDPGDRDTSPLAGIRRRIPALCELHRSAVLALEAWEAGCAAEFDRLAASRCPESIAAETLLRDQLASLGPVLESWRPPPGPELLSARGLAQELALELAPDLPPPRDEATIRDFFRRVAGALRSLATMAVELQRIWADERNHLGVRSPADDLGLLDLSARALIERMVDPSADQARTDAAVVGAAVGLQDHVRALVRSAQRAALDLTARLAPPSFDRSGAATLIPWRGAAAWRSYRDVYNALCGREGERSAETLRELMRAAYAREVESTDRDETP